VTDPTIRVEGVTKHFRIPIDRGTTLKYRLSHARSSSRYRDLLAVDDVSFSVGAGEFLGIAGPNGCGKSTLLKLLSRIYKQDSGRIEVSGRVSPFLELGVGFNPELTARENIFLGGAVLGLTRKELTGRVEEILDFAELTEFADQKLKNFSSGMGVRLAFTVAVQANAEILLMDEVLAVGDARFQEKCFAVFADYKREGRTVVLVSHDLSSLNTYCDRVLLLQKGKVIADGAADQVTAQYRRIVGQMSEADHLSHDHGDAHTITNRWGTREVEITKVRMLDEAGTEHTSFASGRRLTVAIDYIVNGMVDEFVFGLSFKRTDGINVAGPNTRASRYRMSGAEHGGGGRICYEIPSLGLLGAEYFLTAGVYNAGINHAFDHIEDVLTFRVVDDQGQQGLVDLGGSWRQAEAHENVA
jgi:ABC-type polysaccharide/polyol phosphate transport system ATPase subunit